MKILHVVESLRQNAGGAAEIVPLIAEEQKKLGATVTLVTLASDDYSETTRHAVASGVQLRTYIRSKIVPGILGFSLRYVRELGGLIREADVVHVHGLWQFFGWWAVVCTLWFEKKLVMQPHGSLEPERLKISRFKKKIVGGLVDCPLLKKADCVLTTAESEREHVCQYGLERSRVKVIPLGLHAEPYVQSRPDPTLLAKLGADVHKRHVLYFSRITPIKGLDLLAQAWKSLTSFHAEWQLLVVGPDDRGFTEEVKRLYADLLPSESYVIAGPVYGEAKFALLKSCNAFVLPTRSENFSLAVGEAMASGLPVVCTRGAPWEIVECVGAGYWVEISAEAIADGLKKVMNADEAQRRTMGQAGLQCIAHDFAWPAIAQRMLELYSEL